MVRSSSAALSYSHTPNNLQVNEYAAFQLLTSTDAKVKAYKDKYDFYIFPVVNPDGFAYTQTTDRLWRKNRQATTSASCVGRDINRNWPNQWSVSGGASTSPCAEDYRGPSAGDGVETKALKAQLDSIAAGKGVQFYMDIHSYSQLWMYRKFPLNLPSTIRNILTLLKPTDTPAPASFPKRLPTNLSSPAPLPLSRLPTA
jgi:murein tripeptide amidase MpaA